VGEILVTFLATFLIYLLFLGLIILWFIDGKIKKEQVIHALFACLFAWLVAALIKHFFPTLRPFIINGKDVGVIIPPQDGAFPSEHTVVAFALAVTIFFHDRRCGWFFLVAALVIGIARIIANVHYPIDIVGGAFLGTIMAVIVEKIHFMKLFGKKYLKNKKYKR
jgi:undecaprenyl-diphosphatase